MLIALSDTHGENDPELTPHLREQVAEADLVLHAGDFTTAAVLDTFEEVGGDVVCELREVGGGAIDRVELWEGRSGSTHSGIDRG